MGLNNLSDWSPQHAFIDHFHLVRPWVATIVGTYGALVRYAYDALQANGWPNGLPESVILTGYPAMAKKETIANRSGI
ncbi:hypothetical protein [uncultured Sulfitobacter sp.]|uniref:hypothetical protein n=1 Tax=uncultured Sulfitobacter sp. TaxID=191468 RepID=UPI002612502B|nr:hypothetical protein [uncultured Sulfitobacter sp.]